MGVVLRNKYVRLFSQLIQRVFSFPLYCLGVLIPKSKNIWVFGHSFGYKDNPKYLYEYQLKDPAIRAVWISKDKQPEGIQGEWYYYLSIKGLYLQYRAGVVCIATGGADIARFTTARTFIVQLWHGIPVKKLLLDSPEMSPFPAKFARLNRFFYRQLKRHLRKYDLLIAVNKHNQECLSQAFGLSKDKVVITGMPRHDMILHSVLSKISQRYRILYAPTWRPSIKEAEECIQNVLAPACIHFFQQNAIAVDVSIHPLNAELMPLIQSIDGVNIYQGSDINEDLSAYDLLITDFSSIALDFATLQRPVIFMCQDLAKYVAERGIYEYFLDIIQSEHAENQDALMAKISKALLSDYSVARVLYDVKADGHARKRIVEEIKRKV